jgi:capsular exopolysaccharide synthesis family protein
MIASIVGSVYRHLWLVVAITIGVTALTTGIVLNLGEKFTATALLAVDQRDLRLLGLEPSTPTSVSPNVDSEVEIMKSANIAQKVAARLNLASDPRFSPTSDDAGNILSDVAGGVISLLKSIPELFQTVPEEASNSAKGAADPNAVAAQALQKITEVRRRGLTNVIAIDVTTDSPTESARLANAYADTYIDGQIDARLRSAERAEVALSKRVAELGEALRRSETQIKAFALAQASQPNDEGTRREVERLQASIASATRDTTSAMTRLRELDDLVASRNYAALGKSLSVPEMVLLDEQRRALEQRLQQPLEGSIGGGELRQRLELLSSQLQTLTNQRIEPIKRQLESSAERLTGLRKELEQVIQRTDSSTDISVHLFRLQQEAASTRQLYQEYLNRLKALAQQRNIASSDVHVVAAASAPPVKSFPPRTLLVLVGGVAGLALAIGAAYARDNYPPNVKFAGELEDLTGLPNIGDIPAITKAQIRRGISPEDAIFDDPISDYSEALRRLRVSLDLLVNQGSGFRSLLVTSTHPAEGKSTIALSLARAAAEAGLKVVVLDCNLRNPSLHMRLGLDNHNGLAQLLLSPSIVPESHVISSDPRSTCSLITSGEIGDIAPERPLQSPRFGRLMRELGTKFDLIILDAPSVESAADPLILSQHVDAVLLVARSGQTSPQGVQATVEEIARTRNRGIFTALNFAMPSADLFQGAFARIAKGR